MEEMIKKLEEVLSNLEYGNSDLDTAKNDLPDYSANESVRNYISNSESYFESATRDLEDLLEELRKEEETALADDSEKTEEESKE